MRTPPRVEPWVIKTLTAALVVIALVVLLIIGLGHLAELIDTIERLGMMVSATST